MTTPSIPPPAQPTGDRPLSDEQRAALRASIERERAAAAPPAPAGTQGKKLPPSQAPPVQAGVPGVGGPDQGLRPVSTTSSEFVPFRVGGGVRGALVDTLFAAFGVDEKLGHTSERTITRQESDPNALATFVASEVANRAQLLDPNATKEQRGVAARRIGLDKGARREQLTTEQNLQFDSAVRARTAVNEQARTESIRSDQVATKIKLAQGQAGSVIALNRAYAHLAKNEIAEANAALDPVVEARFEELRTRRNLEIDSIRADIRASRASTLRTNELREFDELKKEAFTKDDARKDIAWDYTRDDLRLKRDASQFKFQEGEHAHQQWAKFHGVYGQENFARDAGLNFLDKNERVGSPKLVELMQVSMKDGEVVADMLPYVESIAGQWQLENGDILVTTPTQSFVSRIFRGEKFDTVGNYTQIPLDRFQDAVGTVEAMPDAGEGARQLTDREVDAAFLLKGMGFKVDVRMSGDTVKGISWPGFNSEWDSKKIERANFFDEISASQLVPFDHVLRNNLIRNLEHMRGKIRTAKQLGVKTVPKPKLRDAKPRRSRTGSAIKGDDPLKDIAEKAIGIGSGALSDHLTGK